MLSWEATTTRRCRRRREDVVGGDLVAWGEGVIRGDHVGEMLSEEGRCRHEEGDAVTKKEMLSEERRCCHEEGDVV
jgi:hypothetical protein